MAIYFLPLLVVSILHIQLFRSKTMPEHIFSCARKMKKPLSITDNGFHEHSIINNFTKYITLHFDIAQEKRVCYNPTVNFPKTYKYSLNTRINARASANCVLSISLLTTA